MFYDLKKTACSAKFLFGSYERRTVSGNAKKHDFFNFGAIFRPDLFILTEMKMASIDLTDKKLHAYQFSDQSDHYSSLNRRKTAGNSLKYQN